MKPEKASKSLLATLMIGFTAVIGLAIACVPQVEQFPSLILEHWIVSLVVIAISPLAIMAFITDGLGIG